MATVDVTGEVLSVFHARLAHIDRSPINEVAQSGAFHGMKMVEGLPTNKRSPCVEGTMISTPMRSRNTLETPRDDALHTDVEEVNIPSVSGAEDFLTFIDEVSAHASACNMKTKSEAAMLFKRHVRWVERHKDYGVKKIILDGEWDTLKRDRSWKQTVL